MPSAEMTFEQLLDAAVELLRRKQRLTYVALKRHFELDSQVLADLVQELIHGQRVAHDEDGAVLVWQDPLQSASTRPMEAERRQLTIMFCDLADSTALSNALDPEELRVVLRQFQEATGAVVGRHEGFVNRYMGDGMLVFFGYPRAHEDDAQSAVRAGLEIISEVQALRPWPDVRLQVRVGIATGVVVVGDVIGEGVSREEAVVGNTANLAARLQSVAQRGEMVISGTTKLLVARSFECAELGLQQLKGFDRPVPAWRVVAERPVEELFESGRTAMDLGPLVGREVEFPALLEHWHEAREGNPRVVTLRGEPGLGKSRLSAALRETVAGQDHLVLRYYCSTRFQNTALYPVIRHLRHAARLAEDDSVDVKLDKLERLMQPGTPQGELAVTLPYLAALLSIPVGERYAAIADSPERQREQTMRALEAQITNLAHGRPVLMVFEDMHWVDPTTLALLNQLVRHIKHLPVMLLVTSRQEFTPPWVDLGYAATMELSRLERHDRASLVQHYAGGKQLPEEIVEHILQKSDGVPLFVEELTKAVMDSGMLRDEGDRYTLTGPMRTLAVPSTLHDSLLARLDRLSSVKEVAQVGAAIGREFSYEMLAALLPMPTAELQATLARLSDAGLIFGRGAPPEAIYTFKHALIQDAAYATMLRPKRQGLHSRIAKILEAASGAAARSEPEVLAHHLIEAGLHASAIPHLLSAGLVASARAAHTEACKHFQEGLRLVPQVSDEAGRDRLELGLRVHLGMSLAATRGFAAPEVEATNERARELCRLIGETDELFWVLRGLCSLYIVRADAKASLELADHCVRLGEQTQRAEFLIEGYTMRGYALVYAGALERGREALAKAVDIYRTRGGAHLAFPTPQDPAVACLCLLAVASLILGQAGNAGEHARAAIEQAQASKRPFDNAYAHCFVAMFESLRRDPQSASDHAGIAIEISQRHGFAVWLAAGTLQLGVAKAALGQAQEAIAFLGATLPAWRASGAELNSGFFLAGLAQGYRAAGQLDKALETIQSAIDHAELHGEHFYDSTLYRLRGELGAMRGGADALARADFLRALEIARSQGAAMFELRAAISMADVAAAPGERDHARAALGSALEKIEGGTEGLDYREAVARLDALAA